MNATHRMRVGTRLGPYEITGSLGAGGMGEVYRARDERLGRDVAIKVVAGHAIDAPQARERFEREARSVAGLQHPNVCTVYDVGDADGHAFIVMELLHGETLQQRLRRGPLDLPAFFDVAMALADGLHAAHAAGIVHRDIKPANIFLTERGPKILDFGLAKADGRTAQPASAVETRAMLTEAGATIGTIAYMSPEQLRGEAADGRSDLFSLGLVFYEMATGRSPFNGTTTAAIGGAILHEEPRPPRTLREDLPDALNETVLKALAKDPDLRYQSAADLRADLRRHRLSAEIQTGGISATNAASASPRSRRLRWAALAAVLATICPAVYWLYFARSTPKLTASDTIVLSDFTNTTGDAVFDDALRLGLIVQLQQSPYLRVLPEQNVRRMLTMMGRGRDATLTSAVALEVCQRSSSSAVINGSIGLVG
ncbi:MAG: serine/threonine-protein kinase, partial [Vicinamibacterales bacterium]